MERDLGVSAPILMSRIYRCPISSLTGPVSRTAHLVGVLRQHLQGEGTAVQIAPGARPMLLVLIAFRQRPDLVSAVVALAYPWFPEQSPAPSRRIDVEEIVAAEGDLYQPPADLAEQSPASPIDWIAPRPSIPGNLLPSPCSRVRKQHGTVTANSAEPASAITDKQR